MAGYIERDFLISKLMEHLRKYPNACYSVSEIILILNNVPTAEVAEVKHGEWQEIDNLVIEHGLPTVKGKTWRCSICGEARKNRTAPDTNYCPNCGAKMDKKEGAEE